MKAEDHPTLFRSRGCRRIGKQEVHSKKYSDRDIRITEEVCSRKRVETGTERECGGHGRNCHRRDSEQDLGRKRDKKNR